MFHPDQISDEIEAKLAAFGYAVSSSDRLWVGGYRVHSPESIQFGNYRLYVPPPIFTCAPSQPAHVPDTRDFDLDAILDVRGETPILRPGSIVTINTQCRAIAHKRQWTNEFYRPVYSLYPFQFRYVLLATHDTRLNRTIKMAQPRTTRRGPRLSSDEPEPLL